MEKKGPVFEHVLNWTFISRTDYEKTMQWAGNCHGSLIVYLFVEYLDGSLQAGYSQFLFFFLLPKELILIVPEFSSIQIFPTPLPSLESCSQERNGSQSLYLIYLAVHKRVLWNLHIDTPRGIYYLLWYRRLYLLYKGGRNQYLNIFQI